MRFGCFLFPHLLEFIQDTFILRWGISYCLGWLRQAENSYLAYSADEVNEMPERLRRLLGYFVHEPNLGSVNGIDPYDYVLLGKKEKEFTEFIPKIFKPILHEHIEKHKKMAG